VLEGLVVAVGGAVDVGADVGRRVESVDVVAVGGGVDVGADVGGRVDVDVGTPIVVDAMGSVVFSSCSCLEMEPDDFSFFLSFAAVVIKTIPTIKKTNATTNTTKEIIRSFEYFLVKVVSGPSIMIISELLEDSMMCIGIHSADVPCLVRLVQSRSLFSLHLPLVLLRDKDVIGTGRKSDTTITNRICNAEKCVITI